MYKKNGPEITDRSELLLRQVFPDWLKDEGVLSSQALYPWRDIDDGCLSTDRRSMVTPSDAFKRFTDPKPLGFQQPAVGVWGLLVSELIPHGLTVWEDPVPAGEDHPANPSHAVVEFSSIAANRWKKIGQKLKVLVSDRGRLHP